MNEFERQEFFESKKKRRYGGIYKKGRKLPIRKK